MAFGKLQIVPWANLNLLFLFYFNGLETMSSVYDRANLFSETFYRNTSLDDSRGSVPAFLSRAKLKLNNIFINRNMVSKVLTIFYSSSVF